MSNLNDGTISVDLRKKSAVAILAAALFVLCLSVLFPAKALATEDHLTNGDFSYPAISTLHPDTSGRPNWVVIDPVNGTWYDPGNATTPWSAIANWDFSQFVWLSTQTYNPSSTAQHAQAVELQTESGTDNQYAEIVASEANTSIYQDVSTPTTGVIYKWSLKHASLSSSYLDKMSVLVGAVGSETAQDAIRTSVNGNGDTLGYVGTTIATTVSNTGERDHSSQWETYYGTFEVPEGQTTTRLMFKSVDSRNDASGNAVDDLVMGPAYPLYYNANQPANATVSGTVPLTGKDAHGIYENYYTLTETPTLIDSASSGLTCTGADGTVYHLVGWSKTQTGLIETPAQLVGVDLITTYDGMVASGSDTQLNKVYAVWATDDAVAGSSDVTLTKMVAGTGYPQDTTFNFQVKVAKADKTARTGTYSYTVSDGTSGTLTLDATGTGTITGVAGGDTVTIQGLINGDTYTMTEQSFTTADVTTNMTASNAWSTTWSSSQKLIIPLNSVTQDPVAGYGKWSKAVTSYMAANATSGTISDIPALSTGTSVKLLETAATDTAPNPATDSDVTTSMGGQVLSFATNTSGGLDLTPGSLYNLAENPAYIKVFGRFYLYVDYAQVNTGYEATGVVSPDCGADFTNTYNTHTLTLSKTAGGSGAPAGATFGFNLVLADANGTPLSGSYDATITSATGGTTKTSVTFTDGQATVTGLASGDSIALAKIPDGSSYTVREQTVTANGATKSLGGDWSTTWSSSTESGSPEHDGTQAVGTLTANTTLSYENTCPALLDLTVSKTVTGASAPAGTKFSFKVTLQDAEGTPLSGIYSYTRNDGSTGTLTLDAKGTGTVTGVASGESFTIHKVAVGTVYSVAESDSTATSGLDSWSTTSQETRKVVIPLNTLTPCAVSGYFTWNTPVDYYLNPSSTATDTTISDLPTIPAGSTVKVMRMKGSAPNPGTDADVTSGLGKQILTATVSSGGIKVTKGQLYGLIDNSGYRAMLSSFYLYVDYAYDSVVGTTASGTMGTDAAIAFTNAYVPPASLDTSTDALLTKTTTGSFSGSKTFDFSITPVGNAPASTSDTGSVTFTAAGSQTVSFGTITFTKVGTYSYTVAETTKSGDGWTCDNTAKTVTVEVTKNAAGALTATVKTSATITNDYVEPTTYALPVAKTVTGEGAPAADYTFTLASDDASAPLPSSTKTSVSTTGAGSYTGSFGAATYDEPGVWTYTVSEKDTGVEGVTYDAAKYLITVTVTAKDGKLSAAAVVRSATDGSTVSGVTFANSYTKPVVPPTAATWVPTATDVLASDSDVPPSYPTFSFTIAADSSTADAPMPSTTKTSVKGLGTATFSKVTFTKAGTYVYDLKETDSGASGWTYDSATVKATVTVALNSTDNTLKITKIVYTKNGKTIDSATFENSYAASYTPTTYALPVAKTVTGEGAPAADYTFTLASDDASAPLPSSTKTSVSTTGAGSYTGSFGAATYDEPGVWTYTVSEKDTGVEGITYDAAKYLVTVTVTAKDGKLSAAAVVRSATDGSTVSGVTFVNSYTKPVVPTSSDVTLSKTLGKIAVSPGDEITYTLTATNNGTAQASGIYIKDYVPDNTTYVSCSGSGAEYGATVAGKEYVTWWIDSLAPGASETLTMTVKVNECQSGTGIANTALISVDNPSRPSSSTDPAGGGTSNAANTTVGGASTAGGISSILPATGDPTFWIIVGLIVAAAGGLIGICIAHAKSKKGKGKHSK